MQGSYSGKWQSFDINQLLSFKNFEDLWWMQDGATSHTAKVVISFLTETFGERIISRNSPTPWPAKSPDLNPLDYWFWGFAQAEVHRQKPQSIEELQKIVNLVARTCTKETVSKAAFNIEKRANKCSQNKGSHFESEL